MDQHLVIKIAHMSAASLAFIVLFIRAIPIFQQKLEKPITSNKMLMGVQHLSYTLLILSGLWLLWSNQFSVQAWFYAKIVLFLVILSASIKAFKKNENILLIQRKAGLVIALLTFVALFGLIIIKPNFG